MNRLLVCALMTAMLTLPAATALSHDDHGDSSDGQAKTAEEILIKAFVVGPDGEMKSIENSERVLELRTRFVEGKPLREEVEELEEVRLYGNITVIGPGGKKYTHELPTSKGLDVVFEKALKSAETKVPEEVIEALQSKMRGIELASENLARAKNAEQFFEFVSESGTQNALDSKLDKILERLSSIEARLEALEQ